MKAAQRSPQVGEVGASCMLCIKRETATACSVSKSRAWALDGAKGTYTCHGHPGKSVLSSSFRNDYEACSQETANRAGWALIYSVRPAIFAGGQCHQVMKSSDAHNQHSRRLIV